ncbi:hypothetical protein Y695_04053 [Hydrogenophaga sp. T4]|nr:hypothetical protein Y695_04053 [Hydrogenophaga sp. T4]
MRVAFAAAEDVNGLGNSQRPGALGRRDDEGCCAVGDERAVELVVRRCHPAGIQHVIDAQRIGHLRPRRAACVFAVDHRHLGKLLGGGAELFHVPMRGHGEGVGHGNAEGHFVLLVPAFGHRAQGKVGGQTGQQAVAPHHQHRLGQAAGNGGGGDVEHGGRRGAGDLQRVGKRWLDAQVFTESHAEAVERRGKGGA